MGCGIYTISIHLMLWFNVEKSESLEQILIFQYILCCGSTIAGM